MRCPSSLPTRPPRGWRISATSVLDIRAVISERLECCESLGSYSHVSVSLGRLLSCQLLRAQFVVMIQAVHFCEEV